MSSAEMFAWPAAVPILLLVPAFWLLLRTLDRYLPRNPIRNGLSILLRMCIRSSVALASSVTDKKSKKAIYASTDGTMLWNMAQ